MQMRPDNTSSWWQRLPLAVALRETLRLGYQRQQWLSDILAGLVVALVAVPLSMALAIATGVPPQYGLYTAIIAGFLVALLGGSRYQVTGPTAAFVVVLAPIVAKFGFYGLLTAGMLAGVILLLLGITGMGKFIEFIPHPVTTGFTSGIALVIAVMQLKDFFGLQLTGSPQHFIERLQLIFEAAPTWRPAELLLALITLGLLIFWPRLNKKIPAPLVALATATLLAYGGRCIWPELAVDTIASRFQSVMHGVTYDGVPPLLPQWHWPWSSDASSAVPFVLDWQHLQAILPAAFAIALLGAIESLLSAVIADGMTRTQHHSNAELIALGIGNIVAPFFGGIPATGAIARTATNIRYGATSPFAAISHACFILLALLGLAPLVSQLPMAALAAMLMLVAWRMAEVKHFRHIVQVAPKSDVFVLLVCFSLTVLFDMVVGVGVGIVLAALLFMQRMAALTSGQAQRPTELDSTVVAHLPKGVLFYEIAGPLFFGATRRAIAALSAISDDVRVVIFNLKQVPVMDVTGLVALETTIANLRTMHRYAILVGVNRQVKALIQRSPAIQQAANLAIFDSLDAAIDMANKVMATTTHRS